MHEKSRLDIFHLMEKMRSRQRAKVAAWYATFLEQAVSWPEITHGVTDCKRAYQLGFPLFQYSLCPLGTRLDIHLLAFSLYHLWLAASLGFAIALTSRSRSFLDALWEPLWRLNHSQQQHTGSYE